jgi:VWFA-related protein
MLPRAILIVASVFVIFCHAVAAQEPSPATTPLTYSESIPYKPRLFYVRHEQKVKDKKSKDVQVAPPDPSATPAPEVMPGSGPAVIEDSPVTIPVSVFDTQGKFVSGLKKDDFKIFVDGPETRVLSVDQKDEPLNVLLLLDVSPSGSEVYESVKQLAARLINEFPAGDKISVLQFSDELKELAPLSADHAASIKAISKLKMGNGTSIYDVSRKLFGEIVPTLSGRTAVLFVTDGVDTTSLKTKYSQALVAAEMSGASVYPIYLDTLQFANNIKPNVRGVPPGIQQAVLDALAKQLPRQSPQQMADDYALGKLYLNDLVFLSGGRASEANLLLQNKSPIAGTIAAEIHQQYYLTFSPTGSAFAGQRKHLKVRVDHPNLIVVTRGSYIVGSPPSKIGVK